MNIVLPKHVPGYEVIRSKVELRKLEKSFSKEGLKLDHQHWYYIGEKYNHELEKDLRVHGYRLVYLDGCFCPYMYKEVKR